MMPGSQRIRLAPRAPLPGTPCAVQRVRDHGWEHRTAGTRRRVVMTFNLPGTLLAIALAIQPAISHAEPERGGHNAEKERQVEPGRIGKERLGNKASDDQRVDNCKVAIEERGPKPRPDTCGESVSSASRR